ncbi:serine hydrolase domain-containing protein [Thermomonas sp.]|uniref:serine hydrolase domain-containing protein n=1 Tax=Thermomonas sp. TaxID=1971895 RepID=UPI002637E4B4|nr:serine hydrolase domain-containing protein [Thermomonas sp.]MCO5055653.1 beta-lactamase family protein [Thermomonas sp.]HRO63166.1 serine hydrolase domain-containing protein [Thermomonas sp.]
MKARTLRHAWRAGLIAGLLPLALGSSAQTAPTWNGRPIQMAAAVPAASAAPAVLPPVRLDVADYEAIATAMTNEGKLPGMAMAIVQGGRVVSARGYGVTDVSNPLPIDAHTTFRLASLSKAFAATVTGLLVNDGVLRWDSHLTDYVPAFQLSEPGAAEQLTVADILSHRTGLKRNTFDRDIERDADYHVLTTQLATAPMQCAPGSCYAYQNVAFSLIGDIVFAATGQFYSEVVTRRIFKPLGMNDASYGLEGITASARWARPHVRSGRGWTSLIPKPTYYRLAPAAGVNASISDMAQWLIAQAGHRPDVLPAPLLATLHAPLVDTPGETQVASWRRSRLTAASYALGWRDYSYSGHDVIFHGGAVQGYRAVIAMLPERDLGVVILWNSDSALPSALLPTILDDALGIQGGEWLDDPSYGLPASTMYARRRADTPEGSDASSSKASPR